MPPYARPHQCAQLRLLLSQHLKEQNRHPDPSPLRHPDLSPLQHQDVSPFQYKQFQSAKRGLEKGQVLCVMDFAENMTLRNQDECQSAHWGAHQVTVHPIVCYYLKDPIDEKDDEAVQDKKDDEAVKIKRMIKQLSL